MTSAFGQLLQRKRYMGSIKEGAFSDICLHAFTVGQYPSTSEPNDRSFDDFTSGHSFEVFKLPKVADLGA
jgi:hypothetical protein